VAIRTFEHGDLKNGTKTYPGNCIEEGAFEALGGRLNGQGKRTYDDGRVEEGMFKNGKLV
jgi:hypothetical protein